MASRILGMGDVLSLIEKAEHNYLKFLNLSAIYLAEENLEKAELNALKALEYRETPTALFILAQVKILLGDKDTACKLLIKACSILNTDLTLARESLRTLTDAKKYSEIISVYNSLAQDIKKDGRVTMYYCFGLLNIGEIDKSWEILNKDGGLVVCDIRETETSITDLYMDIVQAMANRDGKTLVREEIDVPKKFDFRMFQPKKKK